MIEEYAAGEWRFSVRHLECETGLHNQAITAAKALSYFKMGIVDWVGRRDGDYLEPNLEWRVSIKDTENGMCNIIFPGRTRRT